jgi:tetratricopeptide (TPR) repeat protein/rRNA maturation endonuclease Nob1
MVMTELWVVDSNCFIHIGSMAPDTFIKSISNALNNLQTGLHVTPGVHDEVRTVRFQRWKGQPNLLEKMQSLLVTITVENSQISGLANLIGEKAAPQDVDLSLMVLASQLAREGNTVTLVTDDFKMTTTGDKANLGFETCPPSTFLQRMADYASQSHKKSLLSLSRRVRAAEMRYAISRAGQYDIQEKLTWMIDSLLETRVTPEPIAESTIDDESKLISALQRVIRGENVKKSHLTKLGTLPEVCKPISKIDDYLSNISSSQDSDNIAGEYDKAAHLLSEVMESIGLGLSPLNEEIAEIAHRAMAGDMYRMESALGMMAKLSGNLPRARNHLSRALYSATLIDDNKAEMRAMHQLGLLALSAASWHRAASLFETADTQAQKTEANRLPHMVAAAISRHLQGEQDLAQSHISSARLIVQNNKSEAVDLLSELGNSLLAIDRPGLAIEVFDEAMECAIESGQDGKMDALAEALLLANSAINNEEQAQFAGLRELLDTLNQLHVDSVDEFETKILEIDERSEKLSKPIGEIWAEWQPSSKLISANSQLIVLRVHEDDNGQELIISHHAEIGAIGLWLPEGGIKAAPGNLIDIKDSRVKVAKPPQALLELHNIRGLVAVESPEAISFIAKTEDLLED